jgi:hypothetical protein
MRDVLQKFVAALSVSADAVIRDAADLAHPKEVIKSVLQHGIKTIEGTDERTFLRTAYLSLEGYQELTDDERKALSAFRGSWAAGSARERTPGGTSKARSVMLNYHGCLSRMSS